MRSTQIREWGRRALGLLLAVSVAGCSLVGAPQPQAVTDTMKEGVRTVIDEQWESIAPYLELDGEVENLMSRNSGALSPEQVVSGLLAEERGEEVAAFAYAAAVSGDADAALAEAKNILPEEVYEELIAAADAVRQDAARLVAEEARALKDEDRAEFMRDVQQLVSRSVVLLTAAIGCSGGQCRSRCACGNGHVDLALLQIRRRYDEDL